MVLLLDRAPTMQASWWLSDAFREMERAREARREVEEAGGQCSGLLDIVCTGSPAAASAARARSRPPPSGPVVVQGHFQSLETS